MMRFPLIIFFSFLVTSFSINGQAGNEAGAQPGELFLRIKNINFFKDNEYSNNIGVSKFIIVSSLPASFDKSLWIEGYTLPGFFIQPELVYKPSGKITLRAGTYLLKYAGKREFTQIRPVLSTSWNLSENTTLTVGSLSGSDHHRMFDPHFASERLYTDYAEDGFQLTSTNDHIFTNTWINWENFILKGDSTRERFTFGESFRYTSPTIANMVQVEVPVQVQFKHFGGQISNYPEHVETFFNLATGLRINIDLARKRFGQAGIEYLEFISNSNPKRHPSPISDGYASWIRLHYTYKWLYLGAAYWKAHNFYSPNGNLIYASSIDPQSDYVIPRRKIITNYFYVTILPESYCEMFLGIETYYDACLKRIDSSITLHLNFDKLFRIATLKP
jgi:hypothetical protein